MFVWATSLLCLWIWVNSSTGLDLSPCVNGTLDAPELTSVSLTCGHTSTSLWWKMARGGALRVSTVATCNATRCTRQGNATDVSVSRPSSDSSVLTVDLSTHRDDGDVSLECFSRHHLSCTVRSVYYSQPTSCTFDVNADAMRVKGSCYIPKIYSSDGNYLCRWTRRFEDGRSSVLNGTFSLTPFVDPTSNLTYMNGTCTFVSSLFLVKGSSKYNMGPSPGSPVYVVTVTIDQASNVTVAGSELVNITQSHGGRADLKITPCGNGKVIDVEEGSLVGLACSGTSTYMNWYLMELSKNQVVARCNGSSCTMVHDAASASDSDQMLATRPNQTFSLLYVDPSGYHQSQARFSCYRYYYYNRFCYVRLVHTSWTTDCYFDFNRDNGTMYGSCHIPKIYSVDGKYKCQWIEQYEHQTEKNVEGHFALTSFTDKVNGRTYKKGTCSFTTPLFEIDGSFTYRISVDPGHQEYIAAVDVAVTNGSSSLTISGRGHVDTHITRNAKEIQVCQCDGKFNEVPFGARLALVCANTAAFVRWRMLYGWNREVASCNATQCTVSVGTYTNEVLATRPNDTVSVLYVDVTLYQDNLLTFICDSAGNKWCSLRTLYASPPTNCQVDINAVNQTISGSCDYEKLYSTQGGIRCELIFQETKYRITQKYESKLKTTLFQDPDLDRKMYRGVCTFSAPIFFIPGTSNFSLSVFPKSSTRLVTLHIGEDMNVTVSAGDNVNVKFHGTPPEWRRFNCTGQQFFSVPLGSAVALTCHSTELFLHRTSTWRSSANVYSYYTSLIAQCFDGQCHLEKDKPYLTSQLDNSTTVLLLSMSKLGANENAFRCSVGWSLNEKCAVQSVYSSPASNCELKVNALNMTVSGSCYISKFYAKNSFYNCQWIERFNGQAEVNLYGSFNTTSFRDSGSGVWYFRGTCSFSAFFVYVANSSISYTMHAEPGDRVLIGTVRVDEYMNITIEETGNVTTTLIPATPAATTVVRCGTSQTAVEVPENGVTQLICSDTSSSMWWSYKTQAWYGDLGLGSCNATSCSSTGQSLNTLLVRPNASVSVLYAQLSYWRESGVFFLCNFPWPKQSLNCHLRPVYAAKPTKCTLDVSADTMTVSGSCDVDKVFSSDQVNCTWIERFGNQTTKFINGSLPLKTFNDTTSGGRSYKRGTCSFSSPLLLVPGVFHFAIHVNPGIPTHVASLYIEGASNLTLVGAESVHTTIAGAPSEMNDQYRCQNGRTVDIPEYTQAGLVCRDDPNPHRRHPGGGGGGDSGSNSLNWTVYRDAWPKGHSTGSSGSPASSNVTCNATACLVPLTAPDLLAVRPNASVSVLYLSLLRSRDYHHRVECRSPARLQFCLIRVVYTSPPASCQFDFNTTTYNVTASCEISKMFSSDGQYTCEWIQQLKTQTTTIPATDLDMTSFRDPVNKMAYKAGRCSVTFPVLMVTEELFAFSIRLSPGNTTFVATLEIGTHIPAQITLTGAENVNTTIDGIPTEQPTTATTPTTITVATTTTSTTTPAPTTTAKAVGSTGSQSNTSPKSSTTTAEGSQEANTLTYVAAGVGGGFGLLILIAVIFIGVFVVRKLSGRHEEGEGSGGGGESDEYFYTPRLKSDSIANITSSVAFSGGDNGSSFL